MGFFFLKIHFKAFSLNYILLIKTTKEIKTRRIIYDFYTVLLNFP